MDEIDSQLVLETNKFTKTITALLAKRDVLANKQIAEYKSIFVARAPKFSFENDSEKYFSEIYGERPPDDYRPTIKYIKQFVNQPLFNVPKNVILDLTAKNIVDSPLNIPLFRKFQNKLYLEVVKFNNKSLAPDKPGFYDLWPYGTYYYPAVGSGVFAPVGNCLIAYNKVHALVLMGFDFASIIGTSKWGSFGIPSPVMQTSNFGAYDITHKYYVRQIMAIAHKYKSIDEILINFAKKIGVNQDPKEILNRWLETCCNGNSPDYQHIYGHIDNPHFFDYNVADYARSTYNSVLLLKDPNIMGFGLEFIDLEDNNLESVKKLVKLNVFDFCQMEKTDPAEFTFLENILRGEEISIEVRRDTMVAIEILKELYPAGFVIGTYEYGMQTKHTDIDFIVIDKIKPNELLEKLEPHFTELKIVEQEDNYKIAGMYRAVEIDVRIFSKETAMYQMFSYEVKRYRTFEDKPNVQYAIRIINQWYHNRHIHNSSIGYLHSTLIYEMIYRMLDKCVGLKYHQVVKLFADVYADKNLEWYLNFAKENRIKMITAEGYIVFIQELKRMADLLKTNQFILALRVLKKKHLLSDYPNVISVTFENINHVTLLKYLNVPNVRFYSADKKIYIFSKQPISDEYLAKFIKESETYQNDIKWEFKRLIIVTDE